ncbi:MAG: hypothetical protein WBH20_05095 [Oceanisphaera sp.]
MASLGGKVTEFSDASPSMPLRNTKEDEGFCLADYRMAGMPCV